MAEFHGLHNEFKERFRIVTDPAMLRAELKVVGVDYGVTSYTTMDQADELARCLELGPGKRLLDVGSGPGWPGSYLALASGCAAVLTDPTLEGMAVAAERSRSDGTNTSAVVALGDELPLRDGWFDAATSSDVFC